MISRKTRNALLASWVSLGLAAGMAFAQPGPRAPEGKWWKRPRIVREIGLTAEQAGRLEEIFERARPALIDLRADLEKRQGELQTLMEGAKIDSREASRRIDEVEQARAKLAKARAMMLVDFRSVLTPDQWERLRELRETVRERRRGRFPGGRPGD